MDEIAGSIAHGTKGQQSANKAELNQNYCPHCGQPWDEGKKDVKGGGKSVPDVPAMLDAFVPPGMAKANKVKR